MNRGSRDSTLSHPLRLTRMEQIVLDLLLSAKTDRQIADELFISKRTVQYHARHIYEKLGCHNRVECFLRAIEAGIAPQFYLTGERQEGAQV